jgi:putative chitinase
MRASDFIYDGYLEEDWRVSATVAAALMTSAGILYQAYNFNHLADTQTGSTIVTTQPVQGKSTDAPPPVVIQLPKPDIKLSQKAAEAALKWAAGIVSHGQTQELFRAAREHGIGGVELLAFVAQCAHESSNFTRMHEKGGSLDFKKYEPKFKLDQATNQMTNVNRLAVLLGNTHRGDGAKFHGRGFIQLTGRYNYTRASHDIYSDDRLVDNPDLVATDAKVAADTTVWFWINRVRPHVTDFSDMAQVTKPINRNLDGLESRKTKFQALAYLVQLKQEQNNR